jgi:nucleotide-binding universal stress UspA family protein
MPKIIVAYDGTPHAEDGLALACALGELLDAELVLAHVHRADADDRSPSATVNGRAEFLRRESDTLLARASDAVSRPVSRHAIASTTTARGLRELADEQGAELIVFGSAHNGPPGRVHPGSAARRLSQSAHSAIAVAPDGFRDHPFSGALAIASAHDDAQSSARRTAEALAAATGGTAQDGDRGDAQLIVLGSSADAPAGQVVTSAASDRLVQAAEVPVIVLANGTPLGVGHGAHAKAAA